MLATSKRALEAQSHRHRIGVACGELLLQAIASRRFSRGGFRTGNGVVARCGGADLPHGAMSGFLQSVEIVPDPINRYFSLSEIPKKRTAIRRMIRWHQERLAAIEAELQRLTSRGGEHAQRVQEQYLAEREARRRRRSRSHPQTPHRQPVPPGTAGCPQSDTPPPSPR